MAEATQSAEDVVLTLKQLAKVESSEGKGVDVGIGLWNGIRAVEYFPPIEGSAFYVLTLHKPVQTAEGVDAIEGELKAALLALRRVWQFSGGARLATEQARLHRTEAYESNAEAVRNRLLVAKGQTHVASYTSIPFEVVAGYRCMPLRNAMALATLARSDVRIARLFEYYDDVWNKPEWYVALYKVREVLQELGGGAEKSAQTAFSISSTDWSWFGKILNNYDLRHAPKSQSLNLSAEPSREDVEKVKQMGRSWIKAFIATTGVALV